MSNADEVGARVVKEDIAREERPLVDYFAEMKKLHPDGVLVATKPKAHDWNGAPSVYADEATPEQMATGMVYTMNRPCGPRVINARRSPMTSLHLLADLPKAEREAMIVDAAVRLNRVLDGTIIDAPGEIGDALQRLRDACVNAGRT